jgi:hypothetical protein
MEVTPVPGARPAMAKKADLGTLTFLAKGGFGQVFRADGFRLRGDPTALAFKEFTVARDEQERSARAAVAFRAGLSEEDRTELDLFCAWPRALVEDPPGTVCGLLMPLIPAEFFCRQPDPLTGQMSSKPRAMSWLIASTAQRTAAQVDIPEIDITERLILLAQLVYAIGRLHKHEWVFGDLSFNNAVFALDPLRLMLLDCDGAAELADGNRKQSSTPLWDPPECPIEPPPGQRRQQDLQDKKTDVYKLGLAILRCLTPGKGAASSRSATRLNGELDAGGTALVARAVSGNRDGRPTAKELYAHLYRLAAPRMAVPEIATARLVTPFRIHGQDARIEWHITNAAEITVSLGVGRQVQLDPAKHPGGYVFRAEESGPVSIEARNRFGSVVADLGELTLYELPPFNIDLNYLPRPQVPAVQAFSLDKVAAMLQEGPRIDVGALQVPPIPSLPAFDLVESLLPDMSARVPGPRIDEAIIDASSMVTGLIRSESKKYAAKLRRENLGSGT